MQHTVAQILATLLTGLSCNMQLQLGTHMLKKDEALQGGVSKMVAIFTAEGNQKREETRLFQNRQRRRLETRRKQARLTFLYLKYDLTALKSNTLGLHNNQATIQIKDTIVKSWVRAKKRHLQKHASSPNQSQNEAISLEI